MIGGPQGSGINASAEVFAKACSRAGLRVCANIEYHSNIMGKHSFYRVRVDEEDVRSIREKADILVALDQETLSGDGDHRRWPTHYGHLHEMSDGGGVIFDSDIGYEPPADRTDLRFFPVPFLEIIKKALAEAGQLNVGAAKLAFDQVRENFDAKSSPYRLQPHREPKARILAKGYEIIALAKLRAGVAFQTYYPISPATDESVYLA